MREMGLSKLHTFKHFTSGHTEMATRANISNGDVNIMGGALRQVAHVRRW